MRVEDLDLDDQPISSFTGKINTPRGQLAAFLSSLSAKYRRMVVGIDLTGWECIEYDLLTESERRDLNQALDKYHILLRSVVTAWNRYGLRQELVLLDFEELGNLELADVETQKRRGAPRKELTQRKDVRRAHAYAQLCQRLQPAFETKQKLRSRGGFASGQENVSLKLGAQRFSRVEIQAVLNCRKAESAAYKLLAAVENISEDSARVSVSRGQKAVTRRAKL